MNPEGNFPTCQDYRTQYIKNTEGHRVKWLRKINVECPEEAMFIRSFNLATRGIDEMAYELTCCKFANP